MPLVTNDAQKSSSSIHREQTTDQRINHAKQVAKSVMANEKRKLEHLSKL